MRTVLPGTRRHHSQNHRDCVKLPASGAVPGPPDDGGGSVPGNAGIAGNPAQGSLPRLKECLLSMWAADPEFEHDHQFQRLVNILRTNGEDLN